MARENESLAHARLVRHAHTRLAKPRVKRPARSRRANRIRSVSLFKHLAFLEDHGVRSAEEQMALDQALLESIEAPLLRVYRWAEPCVSIGYFGRLEEARELHPGLPVVRRWTGGGLVEHGADAPYSLLVPGSDPFNKTRPAESYAAIHRLLAETLAAFGVAAAFLERDHPKRSNACFANPVAGDLLAHGRKIAGAGQRRTRWGLLHQGSVQHALPTPDFGTRFAQALAEHVEHVTLPVGVLERAQQLAAERYATTQWLTGTR